MKKILLIIISIILLISAVIYFLGQWLRIYEFVCEKTNNEKKQGICFLNLAKLEDNEEFCEKIKDYSTERDCYYYFAVKDENIKLCEKTGEKESECSKIFIDKYASKDFCDNIKYKYRDSCYTHLALREKDLNFCKMEDYKEKECYEEVMKKYYGEDLCIYFEEDSNVIECYYYLAIVNKDVRFCSWTTIMKRNDCCREITEKDCIPDLIIEKVEAKYVDEYEDYDTKEKYHRIRIDFIIKNIGSKDAGYFNASIQIPKDRVDQSHVWLIERSGGHTGIKIQETETSGYTYVLKSLDPIKVKAIVDIDDHIEEENEDNNTWEGTIIINK